MTVQNAAATSATETPATPDLRQSPQDDADSAAGIPMAPPDAHCDWCGSAIVHLPINREWVHYRRNTPDCAANTDTGVHEPAGGQHDPETCQGCDHECLNCGTYVPEGGSACPRCRPKMERDAHQRSFDICRACLQDWPCPNVREPECAALDHWGVIDRLERQKLAVLAIKPEDHATTSRDYGRGFAEAIRLVHAAVGNGSYGHPCNEGPERS